MTFQHSSHCPRGVWGEEASLCCSLRCTCSAFLLFALVPKIHDSVYVKHDIPAFVLCVCGVRGEEALNIALPSFIPASPSSCSCSPSKFNFFVISSLCGLGRPHSNSLLPVIKPFTPRASSRRCFTSASCIMQDGGRARRPLLDELFLVIRRRKVCACEHVHIKPRLMRCSTGLVPRDPPCGGGVEVLIQVGLAGWW